MDEATEKDMLKNLEDTGFDKKRYIEQLEQEQQNIAHEIADYKKIFNRWNNGTPEQSLELHRIGFPLSKQIEFSYEVLDRIRTNFNNIIALKEHGWTPEEQFAQLNTKKNEYGNRDWFSLVENSSRTIKYKELGMDYKDQLNAHFGDDIEKIALQAIDKNIDIVEAFCKNGVTLQEQISSACERLKTLHHRPKNTEYLKTYRDNDGFERGVDDGASRYFDDIRKQRHHTNFAENVNKSREGGAGMEIGGDKISDPREKPSESWAEQA